MPHTHDFNWLWPLCFDQLFRQLEHAFDVVVVDMTHHQEIDWKCGIVSKPTSLPYLRQTRLQMRLVNIRWSSIDQHQPRIVFRAVVQNEAIAFACASYVECEDH